MQDSAAFVRATVDIPTDPLAGPCLRAGYLVRGALPTFFCSSTISSRSIAMIRPAPHVLSVTRCAPICVPQVHHAW